MSIEANKAMVRLNCDEMFNQGYPCAGYVTYLF